MRYGSAVRLLVAVAYLVSITTFAYYNDQPPDLIGHGLVFVAPFALGFVVGPLALLLPPVAVLLTIPAGYGSGEVPIWFAMMFVALIALPAIIVGSGARWVFGHYSRRSRHQDEASHGMSS